MAESSRVRTRWGAALGTVVAMIVGFLGIAPAHAAPAAPRGLAPSGVSVTGTPVLEWNRVSGATSYDVEVSSTSEFASLLWKVTTTNRRATPTVQLPAGDVWWRVRGVGSSGSGAWSTTVFDRSSLAGPTLVSPSPSDTLAQPTEPALLSWTPVHGATSYTVEISTDPNLTDPALTKSYTTKTSSMVVPAPQVATDYYWHVRATLGAGVYSEWSETRSYQIEGLSAPVLVGPESSPYTEIDDVVLEWEPVPGAKTYDVQVSTDVNFLTVETAASPTGVTGTRYSPPTTLGNDQYYWRVRPVDALGNKLDWSAVATWEFRRAWPLQPHLEYPANDAVVGDPFFYQWTPVELASSYTLELSTTADFNAGDIVDTCTTVHTTYTPRDGSECWPGAAGSYYWRVIARDELRNPAVVTDKIVAEKGHFTYDPGLVNPVSPSPGATVQIPTLKWAPVAGAENYKVTITAVDGGSGGGSFTTSGTSFTPRTKLSVGKTYRWQVQTLNSKSRTGAGLLSGSQPTFTVSAMADATAASPEPLAPANGAASVRFPTLTWQPVVGATSYRVLIRSSGGTGYSRLTDSFGYPAGEDDGAAWLSAGTYEWKVEAYNGTSFLSTSTGSRTFTIQNLAPVTGQRAALTGTATTTPGSFCSTALPEQCQDLRQTPVLRWTSQPDTGYHQLYISRDREMTNLLMGPIRVESNVWTSPSALIDSQAGSAFYWFVQPCKSGGKCAPLAHATHAFNKISNPVELESPAAGAKVENDVTFTWRDYLATNLDTSGAKTDVTGVNARIEAKQYRVQVSTDANFQSALETVLVDQRTFTSFTNTYPEGVVYWRVQAVDGSGNPLAWSEPRSFVKQSPVPTLKSPLNGATVAGNQPFVWHPLTFAGSYDIEVYKNGDKTGSAINRVVTGTSQQVAFSPAAPLPASSAPYTWRVRRVDAKGRKGAWSKLDDPAASFVVAGEPPALQTPAAGTYVRRNDALFTWQPPADATGGIASYRFERRAAGSSSLAEVVTTASLAWAPTKAIPDGLWEWRVTSLDAAGKPMASSTWRRFKVDSIRPTVVSKSPVKTASVTANFKAKFSERVRNVNSSTMKIYRSGLSTPLSATVTLSSDGRTATLNPAKNLRRGNVYTVKLTSGITDPARNTLVATSWRVTAQ